ncbi:MAG: hypothetical protein GPI90_20590 [Microcystis aeruginosa K13-05]|nr:hypothetical protein [Microcystis sp. 53602_E8]NCR82174.1 hypothetical protein [Microcystis aeruginosa K13-10]NCR86880.1 hypothetical protein [Microcystis aeruginosa K13-05]
MPTSVLKQGYLRDFPVHHLPHTPHPTSLSPHSPIPNLQLKKGKSDAPPFFDNLFKTIVDAQQSRLKLHQA